MWAASAQPASEVRHSGWLWRSRPHTPSAPARPPTYRCCSRCAGSVPPADKVEIVVAPTFVHLDMVKKTLNPPFEIGAQVRDGRCRATPAAAHACIHAGEERRKAAWRRTHACPAMLLPSIPIWPAAGRVPPRRRAHAPAPSRPARVRACMPAGLHLTTSTAAAAGTALAAGLLGGQGRRVHRGGVCRDAARLWHPLGHPGPLGWAGAAGAAPRRTDWWLPLPTTAAGPLLARAGGAPVMPAVGCC